MKAMGHEVEDLSAVLKNAAYRQYTNIRPRCEKISRAYSVFNLQAETADGSGMEITEYFMGSKKCYSFKYNEEFDYDRPGENLNTTLYLTN